MSFPSDAHALEVLGTLIVSHGLVIDVAFQDGEVIASNLISVSAVHEAVTCTDDPVRLVLRREQARCGWFLVLLQDDPDCLIVDHSDNLICNAIFDAWFQLCEAS